MAQRLPVQRINTGPQALRHAQRKLKQPYYSTTRPGPYVDSIGAGGIGTSLTSPTPWDQERIFFS